MKIVVEWIEEMIQFILRYMFICLVQIVHWSIKFVRQ